ncbi:UNVERIFIED_CONTAM: hypothetical protein Cloal_3902 [Acetivibrio alkalicellulosi]
MLRKIFVSLLILSALTSEGTVNIADYLINPHFYNDAGFSFLFEKYDVPAFKNINKHSINDKFILSTSHRMSVLSFINDTKRGFFLSKVNLKTVTDLFNSPLSINGHNSIKSRVFELDKLTAVLNNSSLVYDNNISGLNKVKQYHLLLSKNRKIILNSSDLSPPLISGDVH